MDPKNGRFEDDFPFQLGDFQVSHVNSPGGSFLAVSLFLWFLAVLRPTLWVREEMALSTTEQSYVVPAALCASVAG